MPRQTAKTNAKTGLKERVTEPNNTTIPDNKMETSPTKDDDFSPARRSPRRKAFINARNRVNPSMRRVHTRSKKDEKALYGWRTEDQDSESDTEQVIHPPQPRGRRINEAMERDSDMSSSEDGDGDGNSNLNSSDVNDNTLTADEVEETLASSEDEEEKSTNSSPSRESVHFRTPVQPAAQLTAHLEPEDLEAHQAPSNQSYDNLVPHGLDRPLTQASSHNASMGHWSTKTSPLHVNRPIYLTMENDPATEDTNTPRRAPEGPGSTAGEGEDDIAGLADISRSLVQMMDRTEESENGFSDKTLPGRSSLDEMTMIYDSEARSEFVSPVQDTDQASQFTPLTPSTVQLSSVGNFGKVLEKALTKINPVDTIQLGQSAPVVNLDNLFAKHQHDEDIQSSPKRQRRPKRAASQPEDYSAFHRAGKR